MYARSNQTAKAIATYRRALLIDPGQHFILLNLGLAYLKAGDYQSARPLFAKVPGDQAAQLLATTEIFTGDLSQAITRLEALRNAAPNQVGVLYLLGLAYTRAKQSDKAKQVFTQLFQSAATPVEGNLLLGRAYYEGGHFAEAESAFQEVLESDHGHVEGRLGLAKVFISERKDADALKNLQLLATEHPDNGDAQYYLGALLLRLGRPIDALPHLQAADQLVPNSPAIAFYRGKAAFKLRNRAQAIASLRRAVALNPDDDGSAYILAQVLRADGQMEEARKALEHVRESKRIALAHEQNAMDGGVPPAP